MWLLFIPISGHPGFKIVNFFSRLESDVVVVQQLREEAKVSERNLFFQESRAAAIMGLSMEHFSRRRWTTGSGNSTWELVHSLTAETKNFHLHWLKSLLLLISFYLSECSMVCRYQCGKLIVTSFYYRPIVSFFYKKFGYYVW